MPTSSSSSECWHSPFCPLPRLFFPRAGPIEPVAFIIARVRWLAPVFFTLSHDAPRRHYTVQGEDLFGQEAPVNTVLAMV